jgi:hypothetical protein
MSRGHHRAFIAGLIALALALVLAERAAPAAAGPGIRSVAVLPVENLSGTAVDAEGVRQRLIGSLTARGITVLGDDDLEQGMRRHRMRYTAGIDAGAAEWLKQEAGVDGVVLASLELSSAEIPPKVALIVRLVSTQSVPAVVWAPCSTER